MPSDFVDNLSRRGVPQLVPTGEQKGKAPILLNRPVYQIGARESCRIRLISSTVSQVHAILVQTRHVTYLRDLCSRNGVFVNGGKIREIALHDGDCIKIGRFEFVYRGPKKEQGDEPPPLPATLEVTGSPIPVPVEERVVLIGRRKTADIPLLEESVSNAHAVIFQWEGKRFVRDLGSRTHTFVNGRKIHEKELSPDDVIKVGESEIRYTPSTEMASVDVVESASDSQIAMAPSAEEVDFGIDLATAGTGKALADTIGDLDITDTSHHDTAMIPLSLQTTNLADTTSVDHGLELVNETPAKEEPMPRTWREASTNDLPPLVVEETTPQPLVTVESVAREEATDLGLTSHLDELSPASASVEPLQITPMDVPAEGNVTIDLSSVNLDTIATQSSESEILPDAEKPLIAHDGLIETAPLVSEDISADDTLAGELPPLELAPEPAAEPVESIEPVVEPEKIEVIEATEPTPESALEIPPADIGESLPVSEPDTLSDTTFGRQVEEFTAPSTTGDIVEPVAEETPSPMLDLSLPLLPKLVGAEPAAEVPTGDERPVDATVENPVQIAPFEAPVDITPADIAPEAPAEVAPVEAIVEPPPPVETVAVEEPLPEPAAIEPVEVPEVPPSEAPAEVVPLEATPELPAPEATLIDEPVEPVIDLEPTDEGIEPSPPAPEAPPIEEAPVEAVAQEPVINLEPAPDEPAIDLSAIAPEPAVVEDSAETVQPSPEPLLNEPPTELDPVDLPSLEDLALEALSSSDPAPVTIDDAIASEISPPIEPPAIDLVEPAPEFVESTQDNLTAPETPLDFATSELVAADAIPAVEEAAIQEGNAVIAPPAETSEQTTLTPLSSADLISPPIEPLDPKLEEIDLGLEPISEMSAEVPAAQKEEPPSEATIEPPQSEAPPVSLTDLGSPAAASDPFETPSPATAVPPRPLKKRRERNRPTVIRNFGKDEESAETSGESPFAGGKPGAEPTIAFDAPAGSVDVFGAVSPEVEDSLLSALESKITPDEAPAETRPNRRHRRDTIAPRMSQPPTESRRPAVAYGDMALAVADSEARRKKLLRMMLPVALIGLLLSAAIGFAAWYFVPVVYDIQASIRFDNLGASDLTTQKVFRDNQLINLRLDTTRRAAILKLRDQFPQIHPGFLGNTDDYARAVSNAAWSNQETGLLQLRYAGTDRTEDTARMYAVVLAIHSDTANGDLIRRAGDARRNFAEVNKIIDLSQKKIADLSERIENDRLKIERYQSEKLTAAETQLKNMDKAYQDAFAALKGAQAELDRLKQTSPVAPSTQPLDARIDSDAELAALAQKSQDLAAKLNQARGERADLAKQARESLDAAYQQFQKQIEASQGMMQQSPELAKFVDTAQAQMKMVRELTDDFIASQQKEYQQLAEVKAKLDEKMQSRRADLWAKDEQLQELAGQREISIRKLNAAKSDNLDREIESIQTDLNLIETNIKARQDVLATDPLYAEVINTLQQLIESKQKELIENRKKTDDKLASLQKQFAASLPTVEKLPQEQQALASEMKQRLGEIDAARRQYASAADQSSVENDVIIKSMAQQLASLQGDMEIRKQQILAAQNGVAVKQLAEQIARKEKEVAELTLAKDNAEKAFFASQTLVRELKIARADAVAALEDRDQAVQLKAREEDQLAQSLRDQKTKKNTLDTTITPVEPLPKDVQVVSESDKRVVASISAGGGALLLTALSVLWLSFAAARANPFSHHTAETEEGHDEPHENEPAVV